MVTELNALQRGVLADMVQADKAILLKNFIENFIEKL